MSVRPWPRRGLAASAKSFRPSRRRHFPAPMIIGVISDTHVYPHGARRVAADVFDLFTRFEVGLILHGGDVNTVSVLAELSRVAPVIAVTGNNDESRLLDLL